MKRKTANSFLLINVKLRRVFEKPRKCTAPAQ
jgi:hypothetical protein